jgi:hypothetical protein
MKALFFVMGAFLILVILASCAGKKLHIFESGACEQSLGGQWVCEE